MAGQPCRLVLASASPRRRELLAQIGAEFEVLPAQGEEHISTTKPEQAVVELSRQKAEGRGSGRAGSSARTDIDPWGGHHCGFPRGNPWETKG